MPVRLMTLNPGHFHAALVQKVMIPGVAPKVHVYAPLGTELLAHLGRIVGFNTRSDNPTNWELEVHAGPNSLERCLREQPGNVVVLSGRNAGKIDAIQAAVRNNLHVLADKPWLIDLADLPKLEATLAEAAERDVVIYDIMTERHEITSILQKELINDPAVFGTIEPGSPNDPAVTMESVHYLKKTVAGAPLRRPTWFFDVNQQGEGLTDVGPHLVDLVMWMLFPGKPIDYRHDLEVLAARRWPTVMTAEQFRDVTGTDQFPPEVANSVHEGKLHYVCNTEVTYALRGVHVKLITVWDFESATGGGDLHEAVIRGTKARVAIRQGTAPGDKPELYVAANSVADRSAVLAAVRNRISALAAKHPGLTAADLGSQVQVLIPNALRIGHEAHFAEVTAEFLRYLDAPKTLPSWERPNLLAKYYTTCKGVDLARRSVMKVE